MTTSSPARKLFPYSVDKDRNGSPYCRELRDALQAVCRGQFNRNEVHSLVDRLCELPPLHEMKAAAGEAVEATDLRQSISAVLQIAPICIYRIGASDEMVVRSKDLPYSPAYMTKLGPPDNAEPAMVVRLEDCPQAALLHLLDRCVTEFLRKHATVIPASKH